MAASNKQLDQPHMNSSSRLVPGAFLCWQRRWRPSGKRRHPDLKREARTATRKEAIEKALFSQYGRVWGFFSRSSNLEPSPALQAQGETVQYGPWHMQSCDAGECCELNEATNTDF